MSPAPCPTPPVAADQVAAHPSALAPGLAVTVWDSGGIRHALDECLDELALIQPDVVQLHTVPGDGAQVHRLREALPGVRVWVGIPADHLARRPAQAPAKAATYARAAQVQGVELLVLNGEAAWVGASPGLARDVLAACREAAPGLLLGWTTYDHPHYADHRGPWEVILGHGGVDYSLPQHYPARPGLQAGPAQIRGRILASQRSHARLRGLDPELVPQGPRWIPYGQAHGHTPAGICALSDAAPLACWWALPSRMDPLGLLGLLAASKIRREAGHAPGHVARWQAAHGLLADGVAGRRTLAALGLGP